MTKKEKVLNFVKEHKYKIFTGVAIVAVGGVMYVIGETKGVTDYINGREKAFERFFGSNNERIMMPGFTIKGGLTIADIGKLGEEFMKHDDALTLETEILEVGSFVFE